MNVHEHFADAFEGGHRDRHVIHERRTAAGARQPSREDQVVFFDRGLQDFGGGGALLRAGEFEPPGDAEFVRTGADEVGAAAFAEQQPQRAEEERLARAGLAGPGAEPGVQLDAHVLDERQVLDGQFAEHTAMVRYVCGRVKVSRGRRYERRAAGVLVGSSAGTVAAAKAEVNLAGRFAGVQ